MTVACQCNRVYIKSFTTKLSTYSMASNRMALAIVLTILLVYCMNYGVYSINTQCQGTECTLEDLGLDMTTGEKILQNLTATISKILESQLRIHITHDYNNSSCEATSKPARAPSMDITPQYARDCGDIAAQGYNKSGVYIIRPNVHPVVSSMETEISEFEVYCDLESDNSAWTVFQQRQYGLVDFFRGWEDYKRGFGYFESDFWLGLDKLHRLTTQDHYKLKVIVKDADGDEAYAIYNNIKIGDEDMSYKLLLGDYEGTAGDSMSHHADMAFSTKDRDTDGHCAQSHKGGWWYKNCHYSNLNGLYLTPGVDDSTGITWYHWKGNTYETLKSTKMKIRRMD